MLGVPQRAKHSDTDRVFAALANPTRRDVLDLLRGGPLPASDVAVRFAMARPSVSEHLKVLLDAGLVSQTRAGRNQVYAVQAEPLRRLQQWLAPYEQFWRVRLTDLRTFLDEEDE